MPRRRGGRAKDHYGSGSSSVIAVPEESMGVQIEMCSPQMRKKDNAQRNGTHFHYSSG